MIIKIFQSLYIKQHLNISLFQAIRIALIRIFFKTPHHQFNQLLLTSYQIPLSLFISFVTLLNSLLRNSTLLFHPKKSKF